MTFVFDAAKTVSAKRKFSQGARALYELCKELYPGKTLVLESAERYDGPNKGCTVAIRPIRPGDPGDDDRRVTDAAARALAWLLDSTTTPEEKIRQATRELRRYGFDESQPLTQSQFIGYWICDRCLTIVADPGYKTMQTCPGCGRKL